MSATAFTVGGRQIGGGAPCYLVAEISANHNQQLGRAIEIIRAAKRAGADAIKLQTYTAETLTIDSDREWFQIHGDSLWAGKTLHALYGEAYTPWEWHDELFRTAAAEGLDCFSTPFDASAVELLERLGAPVHKVASFEIVDIPLLEVIGRTGKPVIMSTGMASLAEIEEAVATLRRSGAGPLALLKCTSAYPAPPESMNLRTIPDLQQRFGTVVGGPDAGFSMEPDEFAAMVDDIRRVERALGGVSYECTPEEVKNLSFRRSLFVVADVAAGEPFTAANVRSIRPGHGLHPRHLTEVIGRTAAAPVERGTPLGWEHVASPRAPALTMRRATADDARTIWNWRNDPATRANSMTTRSIPWPEHQAWLMARLADPRTAFYMLEDDGGHTVAQVRYERRTPDVAEVHITVAPEYRGRGLAAAALQATVPQAMADLQVRRVDATVKVGNLPSLRAFERSGFTRDTVDGDLVRLRFDRS
jgi:N-acetylneuraminate synthase